MASEMAYTVKSKFKKGADKASKPITIPVTVKALIEKGAWFPFAEKRKLSKDAITEYDAVYHLKEDEAKSLGFMPTKEE